VVGQAITLSRTPAELVTATPGLGDHTDAVLAELGYSLGDVAALRRDGVI